MTTFLRFPDEARAIACMPGWYDAGRGWDLSTSSSAKRTSGNDLMTYYLRFSDE